MCCDQEALPDNGTGCRMPDISLERRRSGRAAAEAADDEPGAEDETHQACLDRARRALAPAGWRIDGVADE
jgi:hypothetical protein